ncbi:MAG: aminotransferase class IV family protein [Prevotella sp.]|nr:aminotransferase class IV family protein [Prevotella sp.]MDY5257888.1 aminotransferase class IV family protein [Prevotella sp.]
MYPFVETIRIEGGSPHNLPYHQARMERTMRHFFPGAHVPLLKDELARTEWPQDGILKVHVEYSEQGILLVKAEGYHVRAIKKLRLIGCDDIDYTYKSADRRSLEQLARQKGDADEIIIVKHGLLTDTSYSNIALYDGTQWVTPRTPLLKGTMRQALLDEGLLTERDITPNDYMGYQKVSLINAMMPLGMLTITLPQCHHSRTCTD